CNHSLKRYFIIFLHFFVIILFGFSLIALSFIFGKINKTYILYIYVGVRPLISVLIFVFLNMELSADENPFPFTTPRSKQFCCLAPNCETNPISFFIPPTRNCKRAIYNGFTILCIAQLRLLP